MTVEDETHDGLVWVRVTAPDGRAGMACVRNHADRDAAIAAVIADLDHDARPVEDGAARG